MLSTPESWLGIGIVVVIGLVVVGLSTCIGKLIIRLFGTEYEAAKTSGRIKQRYNLSSMKPHNHSDAYPGSRGPDPSQTALPVSEQ